MVDIPLVTAAFDGSCRIDPATKRGPGSYAFVVSKKSRDGGIKLFQVSGLIPRLVKSSQECELFAGRRLLDFLRERRFQARIIYTDNKRAEKLLMKTSGGRIRWCKRGTVFKLHTLADKLAYEALIHGGRESVRKWKASNAYRYPYELSFVVGKFGYEDGTAVYLHPDGKYRDKASNHWDNRKAGSAGELSDFRLLSRGTPTDLAQFVFRGLVAGTPVSDPGYPWSDADPTFFAELRRLMKEHDVTPVDAGEGASANSLVVHDTELLKLIAAPDHRNWTQDDLKAPIAAICGWQNENNACVPALFTVLNYRFGKRHTKTYFAYHHLQRLSKRTLMMIHEKLGLRPKSQAIHDRVARAVLREVAGLSKAEIDRIRAELERFGLVKINGEGDWTIASPKRATQRHLVALPVRPEQFGYEYWQFCPRFDFYMSKDVRQSVEIGTRNLAFQKGLYGSAAKVQINYFKRKDGSLSPYPRTPTDFKRILPYLATLVQNQKKYREKGFQLGINAIAARAGTSLDGTYSSLRLYTTIQGREEFMGSFSVGDAYDIGKERPWVNYIDWTTRDCEEVSGIEYVDVWHRMTNAYIDKSQSTPNSSDSIPAAVLVRGQIFSEAFNSQLRRHTVWLDKLKVYFVKDSMPPNMRSTHWNHNGFSEASKASAEGQPKVPSRRLDTILYFQPHSSTTSRVIRTRPGKQKKVDSPLLIARKQISDATKQSQDLFTASDYYQPDPKLYLKYWSKTHSPGQYVRSLAEKNVMWRDYDPFTETYRSLRKPKSNVGDSVSSLNPGNGVGDWSQGMISNGIAMENISPLLVGSLNQSIL